MKISNLFPFFAIFFVVSVSSFSLAKSKTQKKSQDQRGPSQADSRVQIVPLNPDFPVEDFQGSKYRIHQYGDELKKTLSPDQVNGMLLQCGLQETTANWDQLEKDILIMRAQHYSLPTLQQAYPNMNQESLSKLQILSGRK